MSRERSGSFMEDSTTSDGNTTSNATSEESCTMMRRLLEDIGGQENLSQFMTLLQKYIENSELQILESQQFNEAISHTAFSFNYAYQDRQLFGKFLELSPLYVAAPWFVQQYTFRKRYRHSVSLGDILYVWACCWRVIQSLTNPTYLKIGNTMEQSVQLFWRWGAQKFQYHFCQTLIRYTWYKLTCMKACWLISYTIYLNRIQSKDTILPKTLERE